MTLRAVLDVLFMYLCPTADAEITASITRLSVEHKTARDIEQTAPYAFESLFTEPLFRGSPQGEGSGGFRAFSCLRAPSSLRASRCLSHTHLID